MIGTFPDRLSSFEESSAGNSLLLPAVFSPLYLA
jgi:hypothetical protein